MENFVNYIINNNIKKIEINEENFSKYNLYKFEEEICNLKFNNNDEVILENIIIKYKSYFNYREVLEFIY